MKHTLISISIAILLGCFVGFWAHAFPGSGMLMSGVIKSAPPPPGNLACDYGPNTTLPGGTVGTDLTTAGFTHCALNADFTDNSGATVGAVGHWTMNNPNTYIAACSSSTWGQLWLQWIRGASTATDEPGSMPCNRASIINDAGIGKNVLTYQFAPSEIIDTGNPSTTHLGAALYWPMCGQTCFNIRPGLPQAIYEETTYKIIGWQNTGTIHARDQQTYPNGFDYGCGVGCGLDMVMGEINANNVQTASSMDNYCCNPNQKQSSGWNWIPDEGNYHTLASLSTTDGSSVFNVCVYFDGVSGLPQVVPGGGATNFCTHYQGFIPVELVAHERKLWEFVGDYSNIGGSHSLNATVQIQIQKMRVFTCATYVGLGNHCTTAQSGGSLVYR